MTKLLAALLLSLFFSTSTYALPRESRVPGGVALIALGEVAPNTPAPRAWLGEQRLMVVSDRGQWIALVGLALDLPTGRHELRVEQGAQQRSLPFTVTPKDYPAQHIKLKDKGKVQLSPENEARAVKEIAEIQRLKRHFRETPAGDAADTDFNSPAQGPLASRFGLRRYFNGEARAPHVGLDVAVPRGTLIKAVAPGKVLAVDDYFFNGKTVFVDHGNGLITMYCHLDRIEVQAGDTVRSGQVLALSGATGRASGPHLHWSVVLNGVMIDPELFVAR